MSARREFELKARVREPVDEYCRRLERAGFELRFRGGMFDRTFDTGDERLEASDQVLRMRLFRRTDGTSRVVVGWKGPAAEEEGFKRREEVETRVKSAESMREILARLGFHKVTRRIDRRIHLYAREQVSVRVEEYPRMDVLAEAEGPPGQVRRCLPELGLPREAWKPWPLPEFVRRYEERTGQRALLARPEGAPPAEEGDSGAQGTPPVGEGASPAEGAPPAGEEGSRAEGAP